MKTEDPDLTEKDCDKNIAFHKKEMAKMRRQNRPKDAFKHSQSIDFWNEQKRKL